ncbi:hypothetical protein ACC676_09670 [Rhizobium ruizarguesonis]
MDYIELILASAVPIVLIGGFANRILVKGARDGVPTQGKGIGWQFMRFCVLTCGLPILALLCLRGKLDGQIVAGLIGSAFGYVFGNSEAKD